MMTPEEKAWCDRVHALAMDIVGACGNIERDVEPGSRLAMRARKAALAGVALASESMQRVNDAGIQAEHTDVQASGYDLAALKTAAPSAIEE
jgi:hypothetical protein